MSTLILGAGGLITLQKRLPSMITTLALIGAFLTVRSIGSLHLFAFLAFPFMVLSFNAVSEYLVDSTRTPRADSICHGHNRGCMKTPPLVSYKKLLFRIVP